jgi:hypothetical protein
MGLPMPRVHAYVILFVYVASRLTKHICIEWTGGGIDTTSQGVLAWAFSSVPVDTPSDPESDFSEHTDCEYSRAGNSLVLTCLRSWFLRH